MKFILKLYVLVLGLPMAQAGSVVIVGDSLTCGSFGKTLAAELHLQGEDVELYCTVSSSAAHWVKGANPKGFDCQHMSSPHFQLKPCMGTGITPKISALTSRHSGSRFIVALGTNSLGSPTVDKYYSELAKTVKAGGAQCHWIGPPHMNPKQSSGFPKRTVQKFEDHLPSFYMSLDKAVSPACELRDSRPATAPGVPGNETIDGIHRLRHAGQYWAKEMLSQVALAARKMGNEVTRPIGGIKD